MKKPIVIVLVVLIVAAAGACVALLLTDRSSGVGTEKAGDSVELLGRDEFSSPDLKMKDPDPDKDDFKSIGDIQFDDKK